MCNLVRTSYLLPYTMIFYWLCIFSRFPCLSVVPTVITYIISSNITQNSVYWFANLILLAKHSSNLTWYLNTFSIECKTFCSNVDKHLTDEMIKWLMYMLSEQVRVNVTQVIKVTDRYLNEWLYFVFVHKSPFILIRVKYDQCINAWEKYCYKFYLGNQRVNFIFLERMLISFNMNQ